MIIGGKNFDKVQKTKFRNKKDDEKDTFKEFRKKHKDKAAYRMMKQEEEDNER